MKTLFKTHISEHFQNNNLNLSIKEKIENHNKLLNQQINTPLKKNTKIKFNDTVLIYEYDELLNKIYTPYSSNFGKYK